MIYVLGRSLWEEKITLAEVWRMDCRKVERRQEVQLGGCCNCLTATRKVAWAVHLGTSTQDHFGITPKN